MKSIGLFGPTGLVLLSLPGILSVIPRAPMAPPGETSVSTPASQVAVRAKDGSNTSASAAQTIITEVRLALQPGLSGVKKGTAAELARNTLTTRYGTSMSESSVLAYVWRWVDGTGWVLVCLGQTSFTIDFGSRGGVVVETQDSMLVPLSVSSAAKSPRVLLER